MKLKTIIMEKDFIMLENGKSVFDVTDIENNNELMVSVMLMSAFGLFCLGREDESIHKLVNEFTLDLRNRL